jgi:hypothetical protein
MRETGMKAGNRRWLGVILASLVGCTTPTQPDLKPPPQKEVLNVPPADDTRFSSATPYPKDTLNTDLNRKPGGNIGPVDPTGGRMGGSMNSGGMGPGVGR